MPPGLSAAVAQTVAMKLTAVPMLFLTAVAANWRDAVQSAANMDSCEKSTLQMIKVQIDSEVLGKMDGMSLVKFAGDLQQHRRLHGLPKEVSDLLDKKAKSIGKAGASMLKAETTQMLLKARL
ncbi:Hypothetical protein SCF082_LOCUS34502 [Durusdinium trenchii]|uniref:Uncharacterized protein n=1 Tax=Durusdinium trenchii TaxID=1381693 RepID=A0ABP0NYC1_9DINO